MSVYRSNFKVLVADDHFMARQMVGGALQKHNLIDVTMVSNGAEALTAIEVAYEAKIPFHIVFLDWDMPIKTGFEVLTYFRKKAEYDNTAFVMLTAASQQSEVMQAVKAGATSYIVKPVSRARIEEKFNEICEWVRKRSAGSSA